MNGWHQQLDGEPQRAKGAIGIVVAMKFPEPRLIREKLEEGISKVSPDTVWVMRDAPKENHAARFAWQTFKAHGIEPILAPLVPAWQRKAVFKKKLAVPLDECDQDVLSFTEYGSGYDLRAAWRDIELRNTCERVIVFHDKSSNITAEWIDYCDDRKEFPGEGSHCLAKIYVIERGKAKAKKYKTGRAPH